MELISQKMRRLAPEMDPLRLGCGWTREDLDKPQIIVESTYGDSHPGSAHLNQQCLKESMRQVDTVHVIFVRISATGKAREQMGLTSAWQAAK